MPRVTYITSKYPLLSETFIYEEVLALLSDDIDVQLFAFYDTGAATHAYASALSDRVHYLPSLVSYDHVASHSRMAMRSAYWRTLGRVLLDTCRSPSVLGKSLYAFCKGVMLSRQLLDHPPDHIHAHWATMPTTAALVASRLLGVPFSFTAHAWDIFKEPAMLETKLAWAEPAVTISQYNREHLEGLAPAGSAPIEIVRCGVKLERLEYRDPAPAISPYRILCVARLVEKKGLRYLIDACAELGRRGLEVDCSIVGDGPERTALAERIAELGLEDQVRLLGAMPQERLFDLWRTSHVFALPCVETSDGNRDGIPVALMEVMALGVPVVATRVSGIGELVRDGLTGRLVEPARPDQLADAIAEVLEDAPLARRLARAARKEIEAAYDIRRNASQKARLFRPTPPARVPSSEDRVVV